MLSYFYFIMKSNKEHRNCELGFGVLLFCNKTYKCISKALRVLLAQVWLFLYFWMGESGEQ